MLEQWCLLKESCSRDQELVQPVDMVSFALAGNLSEGGEQDELVGECRHGTLKVYLLLQANGGRAKVFFPLFTPMRISRMCTGLVVGNKFKSESERTLSLALNSVTRAQ